MRDNGDPKTARQIKIGLAGSEGAIEKMPSRENEPARIRISCWDEGHLHAVPLDISEDELVDLIQKAIRAGILSPEFLNKLHDEFEI